MGDHSFAIFKRPIMTSDRLPASATGLLTIDLGQIARNWQAVARLVTPAECGAVVKANAYGLGADRVVPALHKAGCKTFFIATPDEAAEVRRLAPTGTVFALDGLMPGAGEALIAANAIPVLSSLPEVLEWTALAKSSGAKLAAALHVDSGLNRLGLSVSDVQKLINDPNTLRALDIKLVMSHLACADDPLDAKNEQQRAAFDARRALLPKARASLAASDGLMLGASYHYDLVRPGYALYGGQAFKGGATPVRPAVHAAARILQVRIVAAGETVGYAGSWRAPRKSKIAVIAAGYADGYARAASSTWDAIGGVVRINGEFALIAGRVSMDLITADVTDFKVAVERGDLAEIIGPGLSIEEAGQRAGTIGYEVLTSLSRRFHRDYVDSTSSEGSTHG
jgi:alanine racemase